MEIRNAYKNQVTLLLKVLPEVAKEKSFALHGGTAINLFLQDMPRLSVDIDLTYIPIEDRATSLKKIGKALNQIKSNIEAILPQSQVSLQTKTLKLFISTPNAQIKLEVNQLNRGVITKPREMALHKKAQGEFAAFCTMTVVPLGQLYGGKICAALDRQHPRDLFDIKYLLDNDGFNNQIKRGFLLFLLGSNRPIHEILNPNLKNQKHTLENQFDGMSYVPFSYPDFKETRIRLLRTLQTNLKERDKEFLLAFTNLTPDWSIYNFEKFPAIQWKMQNLVKLKNTNPTKFKRLYDALEKVLS